MMKNVQKNSPVSVSGKLNTRRNTRQIRLFLTFLSLEYIIKTIKMIEERNYYGHESRIKNAGRKNISRD